VIWLAYILTEGDHRKVSVEVYINGDATHPQSGLRGQVIDPLDFNGTGCKFSVAQTLLASAKVQVLGSYEGGAVRKMGGILSQHMGQVCADRHVFWLAYS
jgi:hypothetical protein